MNKKIKTTPKDSSDELTGFQNECKKHGLKIITQRIAIYQELTTSKQQPSAITIYRKVKGYFPNIS